MFSIADRRQQRREYLWQKAAAYTLGWISFIGFFTALFAAIGCLFQVSRAIAGAGIPQAADQSGSWPWVFLWAGCASVVLVSIAVSCAHYCERKLNEADSLRYVPPVKVEALPAGEVLVRAFGIATVPQKVVLVRSASGGREERIEDWPADGLFAIGSDVSMASGEAG